MKPAARPSLLRRLLALSAGLAALTGLGCSSTVRTDRITVAAAGKISSLDPAQASTVSTLQVLSALGDPLYRLTSQGELEPQLAADLPQVSPDGLTISIPLRQGVHFHDGTPFNAEAIAFSVRRFLRIGSLSYVVGGRIAAVEAASPHQLVLHLTRPSTSLEGLLTSVNLTPVSPRAYAEHQERFLHHRFVGTGPYRLTHFSDHQQRLEPFDDYWGRPPQNNGLDLISLSNSTALFGALRSGEVDVLMSASIDEDQRHALHKDAQAGLLQEAVGPASEIGYITLLSKGGPLQQRSLRQALALSLDRDEISRRVSYGLRRPLRSLTPPGLGTGSDPIWPDHDPSGARQLLGAAGYCNGRPLTVPLTFRSNVPADKLLALTWQAQIKRDLEDCLVLDLDSVESTTVYRQLGEGAFQAVMLDWRGSYPDPEAYLTPLLSCSQHHDAVCSEGEAAISGSFWTRPGLQEALELSDRLKGPERTRQLRWIQTQASEGSAYIPVWLVAPRAWSRTSLLPPRFDGSGHLQLAELKRATRPEGTH